MNALITGTKTYNNRWLCNLDLMCAERGIIYTDALDAAKKLLTYWGESARTVNKIQLVATT